MPGGLHANSTRNIPPHSPIYGQIDKLIAFGLVKTSMYGQRPWSRNEAARLIAEAIKNSEKKCAEPATEKILKTCDFIKDILDSLEQEFSPSRPLPRKNITLDLLDRAKFEFLFTNADFRAVPAANGVGTIAAQVNPFTTYRDGKHYVRGANFAFETEHWAQLTKYSSVFFGPRFETMVDLAGNGDAGAVLQNAYAKFNIANVELLAGRDSVIWGHAPEGGVLASSNTRPMDMIKISNDSPFKLPWIFKYLGYNKYTFFVSHLGPEAVYKNSLMYGFAASLKPASFVELGFEHQFTFGGDGAPDYSALDLLSEFFFHRRTGDLAGGPNIGDHRVGWNLRFNIPELKRSVIYAEGVLEDRRLRAFWHQFTQQMAFQSGIYMPLLTSDGKNSLRFQYEHIPAAYGRHGSWTSGLSINGLSRGSPFASQSQNIFAEWEHMYTLERKIKVRTMYVNNGADLFANDVAAGGGSRKIFKTADNPQEHRFLTEALLTWPVAKKWSIEPRLGYEFVSNFNFQQNNDKHNVVVGSLLSYDFGATTP